MTVKVGIPRALLYYDYFPLWQKFFESLGAEVVVSAPTSKQVLERSLRYSVDETCLPVKTFLGHISELLTAVDYLFIPRLVSLADNNYYCPKFSGLPDMARMVFPHAPPVLEITVDAMENRSIFRQTLTATGRKFTKNPWRIGAAFREACRHWRRYQALLTTGMPPDTAVAALAGQTVAGEETAEGDITVALVGHGYNIYDAYTSSGLLRHLGQMGVRVLTADMVPWEEISRQAALIAPGLYWALEKKLAGAVRYYGTRPDVDGVIVVVAFECGPDSLVGELLAREMQEHWAKPFMTLVFDEHTGEAGLLTRLEAFVDMVKRRGRR